jgi:hypothetical protein
MQRMGRENPAKPTRRFMLPILAGVDKDAPGGQS